MKAQYNTFEEAEEALNKTSNLKNKIILDNVTAERRIVSAMIIFPNTYFENGKEMKTGYDIAVFFKNEINFVLLKEIRDRFFTPSDNLESILI
jgi:hypothetical protein